MEIHGQTYTKMYNSWRGMKERCYNKNNKAYKYYGLKGISIYYPWLTFNNFKELALLNGYEVGLTIDRIDSNKDYCPENCCWIPHIENVIKSNKTRYLDRYNKAREYWINTRCTGKHLSDVFQVSFSIGCRWIRQFKKEKLWTDMQQH